ncbi:uncharacterized protein LOC128236079 isoform X5 [Mya arenaria]|uniref:uncharacterized protein LOC128236079 isoform X5 n=1 Tax=Mya arenaria TaxID=6604 RepID=UPI0022E35DF4|nr:uncharacterized protein LOC128236079 isoform X5 [Mya arenaria]
MAWIQFCLIAFLLPWVWQTLTSGSGMDGCRQNGQFSCPTSTKCIDKSLVCNGNNDCYFSEDERPPACGMDGCRQNGQFFCPTAQKCIDKSLVCNGNNDCYYFEDERPPACDMDACRRNGHFFCNDSRQCILKSWVCDGYEDCKQGEDEAPPACDLDVCRQQDRYFCNDSRRCISKSRVCDGDEDCKQGEDEDPSACDLDVCRQQDRYFCNDSRRCISKSRVCNGRKNCDQYEDEDPSACVSLGLSSTDKENVNSLNAILIVVPAVATVVVIVVVVVGIICYLRARKRFNRQLNERMEPRRVLPVHIPPARQPSRSRRRASSYVYDEVNEETMEHYHYICEQNAPDHYDKIKDRKPCICPHCVRERVIPFLNRISSGSSSTTFVEPYAVGGGSISSRSYVSNSEINPRRSAPKYDHDGGIVPTKELTDDSNSKQSITKSDGKNELDSTDDSKPWRSVTRSDGALDHVGKTDNADGFNPGPCVAKSDSNIELVCTPGYLDLEALYQKAKAEDRRKLAAKYLDYGEDVFGEIGQFRAIEREECELPNNEIELQSMGQNIESSLSISGSELIEESCCSNNTDSILKQQPDEATRTQTNTERSNSDEIKQTDSVL